MGCATSRSTRVRDALTSDGTRDSELQALFLSYDTRTKDGRLDAQEAEPLLQAISTQLASAISGGDVSHAVEQNSAQWSSLFADGALRYGDFRTHLLDLKSDILACMSDSAASRRPGAMPNEMKCLFNDVAWRQTKRMLAGSAGLTAAALVSPGPAEPQMRLRELWHGVGIPVHDTDLPGKTLSAMKRLKLFLAQRVLPAHTLDDTWASRERAIEVTTRAFSPYARALSNHPSAEGMRDWVSDAGTGAYAFQAQGCVNLERMPNSAAAVDGDGAAFVHRAMHFERYQGVAGTHRLGCDTFFSSERLPVRIALSDGRVLRPVGANASRMERDEWENAKYMFRSMLFYQNNVSSHFIRCHLFASNSSVIAARKHLGPNHPIRRLLHPFQWGAIAVNSLASNGLFTRGGIVQRNGWEWEGGLLELCKDVLGSMRRKAFPEEMAELGMSGLSEGVYPLAEDGALIWATFESFTRQYFELHRLTDGEGGTPIDDATRQMWAELQVRARERGSNPLIGRTGEVVMPLSARSASLPSFAGLIGFLSSPPCP